jgi:periplasmic divalent cation tolerance protein
MSATVHVVLCTAPNADAAESLARGLVDAHLAACVNVVPAVRSFYRWEGEIHDDAEELLVVKTTAERLPEVEAFLVEHHPYDVPEVIALPVTAGSERYLAWVRDETKAR